MIGNRLRIDIDIGEADEREYCFKNSSNEFFSGNICIVPISTPLYDISGILYSEIQQRCIFLYKIKEYYFVQLLSNNKICVCPKLWYYARPDTPKNNEIHIPIGVQLGTMLYWFVMAFGLILKERIAWWVVCTIIFITWKNKKLGGNKNE